MTTFLIYPPAESVSLGYHDHPGSSPSWWCRVARHCAALTRSLCSLLVKSKAGRMDLNLFRISLCLVMSVARMHLQLEHNLNQEVQ